MSSYGSAIQEFADPSAIPSHPYSDPKSAKRDSPNPTPDHARLSLPTDIEDVALGDLFPSLAPSLSLTTVLGPATPRGDNALQRSGAKFFSDIADWRLADLRKVRNLGPRTVDEVIAALRAAESDDGVALTATEAARGGSADTVTEVQRTWTMSRSISALAVWASTYVDGRLTLLDAVAAAEAADDLPKELRRALRTVTTTPMSALAPRTRPITPADALRTWVDGLSGRERRLLSLRTLSARPLTYDHLSTEFGISGERVRQIENALLSRAHQLFSPDWLPLGRALAELRAATAPIAPIDAGDLGYGLLRDAGLTPVGLSEIEVLARLSGAAEVKGSLIGWPAVTPWLDRIDTTITSAFHEEHEPAARYAVASAALIDLGLPGAAVPEWLRRRGYAVCDDTVTAPPRHNADRAYRVLAEAGRPLTTDQILDRFDVTRTPQSLRRAMDLDDRIIRVGAREWALATPGRREYQGLRDAIGDALDEAGRPLTVAEVIASIREHYVVAAHSVRVYAGRPPFTTTDGVVSRSSAP